MHNKNKMMKRLLISCLLWTAFLCEGCARQNEVAIYTELNEQKEPEEAAKSEDISAAAEAAEAGEILQGAAEGAEKKAVFVQVCGAVREPGVYELREGDRVFEAIEKAGGLTEQAAMESVNQAAGVTDGQMIIVSTREEWSSKAAAGETAPAQTDERIDINTADERQLTVLPGIGEAIATRIVAYREENGAFCSIEDIKKVSGIGEKLFEKIKDRIRV